MGKKRPYSNSVKNRYNSNYNRNSRYTAKKNDVNLTDFVVKAEKALPAGVSATFYLYIDGKEVADTRIKAEGTGGNDSISISTILCV